MSSVLLVWENFPESIEFFRLPADHPMVEVAKKPAGKYIYSDDLEEDDPIYTLSEFLASDEGKGMKLEGAVHDGPFASVISCGCMV